MNRTALPEGHRLKYMIDFRNNGKLVLLINLGTLAVIAVMIFLMHQSIPFTLALEGDYTLTQRLMVPISILLALMLFGHVRELLRLLSLKLFTKQKTKYKLHVFSATASLPNYYMDKKTVYLTTAAPMLMLGVALAVVLVILGGGAWFWVVYLIESLNIGLGVKDVYVIMTVKDMPDEVCMLDEGMDIKCYWPDGAKWKIKEE